MSKVENVLDIRDPESGSKDFAIIWFRGCNSGIILKCANSIEDACQFIYSPKIVQHVAFEIPRGSSPYSIGVSSID